MELEMPEQLKDSPITLILTGVLTGALLNVGATELAARCTGTGVYLRTGNKFGSGT